MSDQQQRRQVLEKILAEAQNKGDYDSALKITKELYPSEGTLSDRSVEWSAQLAVLAGAMITFSQFHPALFRLRHYWFPYSPEQLNFRAHIFGIDFTGARPPRDPRIFLAFCQAAPILFCYNEFRKRYP
jgi:hypothetical protein